MTSKGGLYYRWRDVCPKCGYLNFRQRKLKKPRYVCYQCGHKFDQPAKVKEGKYR